MDTSSLSPYKLQDISGARQIFRDRLNEEEQRLFERMTSETLDEMREFFDLFVEKHIPKIHNSDIVKVMNTLGEFPKPERLAEMIKEIDYNGDGMVDFDEFTCLMIKQMRDVEESEEELVQVFQCFDKDDDGFINASDLLQMMRELGNDMSVEEAENMIYLFDSSGDAQISFPEFIQLMMYDTLD